MKTITVFTSNQPRHVSLIKELSKVCDKVFAIIESNTVHPGKVNDLRNLILCRIILKKLLNQKIKFSEIVPLIIKMGDLNKLRLCLINP